MQPQILTLSALRDSSRYTLVPHVPMLDIHEHINDEKPEVDEDLLELIARNTNERIANLAIPAGNAGHTCEPGECSEDEQPETIGYVINWEVDEFNGRPCLYADVYYRNDKLKLAKKLPYRSVERYISDRPDRNFIDAVSFQKSAPERDLGVLEFYHRSMEPGDTIVRYGRDMPAIKFPSGGGVKVDGCGCDTKADEPKTSPKTKPKARKNKGQFKKGEPKAATTEAEPKGGKKNKGHFKVGNDHHKRRQDRKLNEGVQVNMEHLKETILGLLKQSKTGTIKARYSLDDPFATKTTSTAGPSAKVGQDVRSAFGHLGTVIGSQAMTGKAPPQAAPRDDSPKTATPLAAAVGPGRGTPPKVAPKPKDNPNATQAMPGQQPQQPQQQAPVAPPAAPAHTEQLPGAAKVSTKVYDQAQRDVALGKTPTAARGETPTAVARGSGYPGAANRASGSNPSVRDALAPVSPKSPGQAAPPSVAKVPRQPASPPVQPTPTEPAASRRESAAAKLAAASAGSASANPIPMPNPRKERAKAKLGAAASPADSGRGPIPLTGSVRNPGPEGPLESGAVSPRLARTFKAATNQNVKPSSVSAPNGPPIPRRTIRAAGQSVAVQSGAKAKQAPLKAPAANPLSGELSKAKAAAKAGDTDAMSAFIEKHRDTPVGKAFTNWMMNSSDKPAMPQPKLSPKPIGGKRGVFDSKPAPIPSAMPKPELPRNSKKVRIEAGDKLTSKKGGTFSVIGHTPDNGSERFVHLKNDKTGKEVRVPRARFHAALQRGEITPPDEAFTRTAPKPAAKPTAPGVNPKKDPAQSPYRKLDAQDWTSDKAPGAFGDIPSASQRQQAEVPQAPPEPPMDRKQAREQAWKQQYNAARQFNGGKHLSPRQRKELEDHFNRTFREAERQGLTKNFTPQPDEGSPFGTLPKHWHDPRLKLSPGNYYRDHSRSIWNGILTGLSGRIPGSAFDYATNPPHLGDLEPALNRSNRMYRGPGSRAAKNGMVHQSSVPYATKVAAESFRQRQMGGNAQQAGIGSNASPRANSRQSAQPNPALGQQRAEPHVPQQADPRVRPSRVVTPEEMAAAPPKIQHSEDKLFGQVVDALAHQRIKMTPGQYREFDAKFPDIKEALAKIHAQKRAEGKRATYADAANVYKQVMSAQTQAPVAPQEPAQAAPAPQAGQQASASPRAAQRLQAAYAMASGAKADPAFAKDPVVLAAVLAADLSDRAPTAEDIDRIHQLRADTFRETRENLKPDDLAHAYLHGQQQAPQVQPQPEPGQHVERQVDPQAAPQEPVAEPQPGNNQARRYPADPNAIDPGVFDEAMDYLSKSKQDEVRGFTRTGLTELIKRAAKFAPYDDAKDLIGRVERELKPLFSDQARLPKLDSGDHSAPVQPIPQPQPKHPAHVVPPGPSVRQPDVPRPGGPVMSRDEKKRNANDAVAALMALQYNKHAAQKMVKEAISKGAFKDLPDLIQRAIGKPAHPSEPAPKPSAEQVAKMRRTILKALKTARTA